MRLEDWISYSTLLKHELRNKKSSDRLNPDSALNENQQQSYSIDWWNLLLATEIWKLNPVTVGIPNIKPRFWLKILLMKQSISNEKSNSKLIDVIHNTHHRIYIISNSRKSCYHLNQTDWPQSFIIPQTAMRLKFQSSACVWREQARDEKQETVCLACECAKLEMKTVNHPSTLLTALWWLRRHVSSSSKQARIRPTEPWPNGLKTRNEPAEIWNPFLLSNPTRNANLNFSPANLEN